MLAYSEFSVQKNVLSVTMSSIAAGSSQNLVLTMGYIDAWNGNTNLCSTTNTEDYPSITMRMKAQTVLNRIVLVPPVCTGAFEQSVDVFLINYDTTSTLCGNSLPSIYTNFEFNCGGTAGYQVKIVSKTTASVLKLCSVGILSTCDCSLTSFLQADMPDYGVQLVLNSLTASYNGLAVTT
jgi:hypothetical protein